MRWLPAAPCIYKARIINQSPTHSKRASIDDAFLNLSYYFYCTLFITSSPHWLLKSIQPAHFKESWTHPSITGAFTHFSCQHSHTDYYFITAILFVQVSSRWAFNFVDMADSFVAAQLPDMTKHIEHPSETRSWNLNDLCLEIQLKIAKHVSPVPFHYSLSLWWLCSYPVDLQTIRPQITLSDFQTAICYSDRGTIPYR